MSVLQRPKRLKNIHARPEFPEDLMRVLRMTYHIQKRMKDLSNAALRKYDLVDASYMVLAVLYGSRMKPRPRPRWAKPAWKSRPTSRLQRSGSTGPDHPRQPARRPRCVMIKLTDTGRALVEKVLPEVYGDPRLRRLQPVELKLLEDLLRRQLDNLEALT
jgi:MarR family transcriptional repressor of emrRAB